MAKFINSPRVEVELIRDFFQNLNSGKKGVFVDVGANDPVVNSQSWHLEQLGWTGILIEPLPEMAERLRSARKARVFQVACAGPDKHGQTMQINVSGPYSSLCPELMVPEVGVVGVIPVAVCTLNSVLQDAGIHHIDFLSIDVEGFEIDVLQGLDLQHYRPKLILIEDHVYDLKKHRYLSARNYNLIRRTGLNAWYVPADYRFTVGFRGQLSKIRKYYLGTPLRSWRFRNRLRKKLRASN